MKLEKLDHKYLGRDSEPDQLEITQQSGSYLYTKRGKKYVDMTMGWCVGNFGWDNPDIKKRLRKFDGPDYVSPHYLYKPWAKLAHKLEKISPGELTKSFRATGGTEAVDIAMQAAMHYTERTKFISVAEAYHGDSIATISIGSPELGPWFHNPFSAYRIKPPLNEKSAELVENRLKKKDIAALIMEPILCNRGVMIPEQEFMTRIQAACRKYGTLFIMDEVATGFYRTGKFFACEHFGVNPDILCMGKAITGGLAPMGAVLMTEKVAQAMKDKDGSYSTFGWHPHSVEAALATLKYIDENQEFLETNIREMGNYIVDQITSMNFKQSPQISAKGLAIGVSFESEKYGKHLVEAAKNNGLIISQGENGFCLFPALTIDRKTVDEALDLLRKCLKAEKRSAH